MKNGKNYSKYFKELIEYINNINQLKIDHKKHIIDKIISIQKRLKEEEKYDFKEIVDNLYDGVYIADGNGDTLYVNKAYTNMTGLKENEIIGKNVKYLVENGIYHNAVTPEVIKQKKTITSIGKARNGIEMLITGNPVMSSSGIVRGVVVIDRDISELAKTQKELELSQKKIKVVEKMRAKREREIEHLRKQQLNNNFIGNSEEMKEVSRLINKVANFDVTVLITGESGVGKEVVANQIFMNSSRSEEPFIKVNCAAIPASLLESELFGYEKGAFTNATSSKAGFFELADKGTLMLDEIGDMTLDLQGKLLRTIQHKQIVRVGGRKTINLDVRIIAATNVNLKCMVEKGKFREDLYYRINVFPIHIPPLRLRRGDIDDLLKHFFGIYNNKYGKEISITNEAINVFKEYKWPGNIRELQNIIERIVIISDSHALVGLNQIIGLLNINNKVNIIDHEKIELEKFGLKETVESVERDLIKKALQEGGSTRKAAKILKISQSSVVKKAKKLSIDLTN